MNKYEALFIINPDRENSSKEITDNITNVISKAQGKLEKEENWPRQRLSHPIRKKKEGLYYKIDFSIDPSKITELKNAYKLNSDILRVMITKKLKTQK